MKKIALSEPYLISRSLKYLKKSIYSNWVSTSGPMVKEFERKICNLTGAKYAIACNSGTAALHIGLKLAEPAPGDEVIVPTLTFVATVNCVIYNNCSPIFMDCDEFFNIDKKKTLEFLKKNTFKKGNYSYNKQTKKKVVALIITHVWGNAAEIKELVRECKKRNIKIIEDASESIGTKYKSSLKHTGAFGLVGIISFNGNKLITTGGGGILITNIKKIADRAKYLTSQAKDNSIFFIHNEVGYNYRMTNLSAALGLGQIDNFKFLLNKKKEIRKMYEKKLKASKNFELRKTPDYAYNNFWMNVVKFKKGKNRVNLNKTYLKFKKKNIEVRPIWKLNHSQKMFKNFQKYKLKKATELASTCICVPSSASMNEKEIKLVSKILNE